MSYFVKMPIIERIKDDVSLRLNIAVALGIMERAVYNHVLKYKKEPFPNSNFTKAAVVKYLISEGYTEDEILTKEQPAK